MKVTSKDFLETMVSPRQKQLFLRLKLYTYSKETKDFEEVDTQIIQQRMLPNGIDVAQGGINVNTEQDISSTIDLVITNHTGVNNWGAYFDNTDTTDFKWWLDKRMSIDFGLKNDKTGKIEFVRMGSYIITHFKSNHNLVEFPVTEIQGSSKEVLFASRRGKFLYPTQIRQHTNMVETIKTILIGGGEKSKNIYIDPTINKTHIKLDEGENLEGWRIRNDNVIMSLDTENKAHGESSLKLEADVGRFIDVQEQVIAEKTFEYPVDIRDINAMALWARCSTDLPEGAISLVLTNRSGYKIDLPLRELVGHVVEDGEVIDIDNWRNILLPVKDDMGRMSRVVKMEIRVNRTPFTVPFTLWLDQIYCADIRNMVPYDLTYGAGQSRWAAVKEISYLLDCRCYYDEWGNFHLEKNKFPRERHASTHEYFDYDAYEVLQPVITYSNKMKERNLYAGTQDVFEEHELSNHIQVVGGSTASTVTTLVDMALYDKGLQIKEKGKVINPRGKIRAIDTFDPIYPPIWLNGSTDVGLVWKGHKNEETVLEMYPNGFPHLEEPPINNFAIERIGDFIYHHNNASPDPLIWYVFEGKNRALRELRERLAYAEQLDLLSAPFYVLSGGDIIRVEDSLLEINDNFQIKSMNIPLNGDYMSITAVKIHNFLVDVPYFDISPLKHTACFYGYDAMALAFTFPL